MFSFFKRKRELPSFEFLENSKLKNQYFVRLCPWDWLTDDMIHVFDINSPRVITMDPWPQLVYLHAKGDKPITEFVFEMASQYGKGEPIPNELDKMILDVIESLKEDRLIEISELPLDLPRNIELSKSEQ